MTRALNTDEDQLQRILDWVQRHPRTTLASGDAVVLVAHIGLLLADLTEARTEIDRLTRILAALREPSETVIAAVIGSGVIPGFHLVVRGILESAVAAAEKEVGG